MDTNSGHRRVDRLRVFEDDAAHTSVDAESRPERQRPEGSMKLMRTLVLRIIATYHVVDMESTAW
jgi:hypothetical protein